MFVLTREHNDYDQHGEYFVCLFKDRPSIEKLAPIVSKEIGLPGDMGEAIKLVEHVRKGGGRIAIEDVWLNLDEYEVL